MLCNRRASRPSRGRLVGPAFALLIAAMMALIFAGNASAATPVPACEGTTEDPVPAGAYLLDGPREADLIAGRVVPLHDNFGRAGSLVPGCMARIQDGVIVSEWAYCTDENRGACIQVGDVRKDLVLQNPKFDVAVDPLGPEKERVIAYLAQHGYAGVVTNPTNSWDRQTLQRLIWCVSDGPVNSKTNSADAWCALNFTDADFDAVSDLVPDDPNMVVTAETVGPLEIGEEARFTVRTNAFGQPIALGVTGPGAMTAAVCGGPGVLTAGELRVTGADTDVPETVTICVTGDAPGTIGLDAEVVVPHRDNMVWAWNGSPNCQVFATFSPAAATPLSGSAAAVVRAPQVPVDPVVPTIPTEPTVPDQPTTPVEPTIPAVPVTPTVPVSGVAPIINQAPRFAVAKRASVGRVLAGQRVRFTITVRNRGVAVRNLRVCDVLPDRASVVSRSAGARVAGGRICWTVARLAPGRSATRSVVLRVDQTAPAHRLVNRAVAAAGGRSESARATVLVRPVVRTVASQVTG